MRLNTKDRIKTTSWLAALGLTAILFSKTPYFGSLFILCLLGLALTGWQEFCNLAKKKQLFPECKLGACTITLFIFSIFFKTQYPAFWSLCAFIALLGFAAGFILAMMRFQEPLTRLAITFFGIAYITLPIAALLEINYSAQGGRHWLLFLLAVVKINDIGGYLIGKQFGKRPLAPKISPQKTWEGAFGGFFLGIATALLFGLLGDSFPIFEMLALGIVLGIAAQFGDLAESILKRDAAIKDSSNLVGLGGVLDITDSLAFSAPLLYIYLTGWRTYI